MTSLLDVVCNEVFDCCFRLFLNHGQGSIYLGGTLCANLQVMEFIFGNACACNLTFALLFIKKHFFS